MKEVSRQLAGVIEIASSPVVKKETRVFRKRSLMVQISRAKAQLAFFEEMLRLEESMDGLEMEPGYYGGNGGVIEEEQEEVVVETPRSTQVGSLEENIPRRGPGGRWH